MDCCEKKKLLSLQHCSTGRLIVDWRVLHSWRADIGSVVIRNIHRRGLTSSDEDEERCVPTSQMKFMSNFVVCATHISGLDWKRTLEDYAICFLSSFTSGMLCNWLFWPGTSQMCSTCSVVWHLGCHYSILSKTSLEWLLMYHWGPGSWSRVQLHELKLNFCLVNKRYVIDNYNGIVCTSNFYYFVLHMWYRCNLTPTMLVCNWESYSIVKIFKGLLKQRTAWFKIFPVKGSSGKSQRQVRSRWQMKWLHFNNMGYFPCLRLMTNTWLETLSTTINLRKILFPHSDLSNHSKILEDTLINLSWESIGN